MGNEKRDMWSIEMKNKKVAKPRFTFKKEPHETGLRAVGHPQQSDRIKLNKKEVGQISAPNWQKRGWTIGFMIMGSAGNPNCDWHWKFLPERFSEEQKARDWIQEHAEEITSWGLRASTEEDS